MSPQEYSKGDLHSCCTTADHTMVITQIVIHYDDSVGSRITSNIAYNPQGSLPYTFTALKLFCQSAVLKKQLQDTRGKSRAVCDMCQLRRPRDVIPQTFVGSDEL